MGEAILVTPDVRVPGWAVTVRAVRASGPGGQNVNKVATKIALRVDIGAIEGLTESARRRVRELAGRRLDREGHLVVTSQVARTQSENLEDARARVRDLIAAALVAPRSRVATRPTRRARERRIADKKRRSDTKRLRGKPAAGN